MATFTFKDINIITGKIDLTNICDVSDALDSNFSKNVHFHDIPIENILNDPKMQFNQPYIDNRIDWSMMSYNDWKTPEFWAKKYPAGLAEEFPGLWQHFEYLAENAKSPLEEWEEIQKKQEIKIYCESESVPESVYEPSFEILSDSESEPKNKYNIVYCVYDSEKL